jgi:hypothetical protein
MTSAAGAILRTQILDRLEYRMSWLASTPRNLCLQPVTGSRECTLKVAWQNYANNQGDLLINIVSDEKRLRGR